MGSNSSLTSPNELEVPAEWARMFAEWARMMSKKSRAEWARELKF